MSEPATQSDVAVRLGLVVVAFVILWRLPEPALIEIPDAQVGLLEPEPEPLLPTLLAALGGIAAGFLFALAGRSQLSGWTFRLRLPLILGSIPLVIVAVQLLVFSGVLPFTNEGFFGRISYFLVSDFPLRISAILLGVAIAQGVLSSEER